MTWFQYQKMPKVSFDIEGNVQSRWKVVKISSATLVLSEARMELYRMIGERITHTRQARGLSRPELGKLIGVLPNKIENIECCRFGIRISVALMHAIATALDVAIADLLPCTDEIELARISVDETPEEELTLAGHHSSFYQQQIGRRIYLERTAKGFAVGDLAAQIPYPIATIKKNGMAIPPNLRGLINRIEQGKTAPSVFMLLAIAKALDCAIEDLIPPIQIDVLGGIVDILSRTGRRGAVSPNALLLRDLFRQGYGEKIIELISDRVKLLEEDEAIVHRNNYLVGLLGG